jgi:hypothetical protein
MAYASSNTPSVNELDDHAVFIHPDAMDDLTSQSSTRSGRSAIESTTSVKRYVYPENIRDPRNHIFMQCLSNSGAPGVIPGQEEYYYIHLSPYEEHHSHIIDSVSPLMKNPDQFEVGAKYTFVLASIGTRQEEQARGGMIYTPCTEIALYAAKANSVFEHGTKHKQIFFRMSNLEQRAITACAKSHSKGGKRGNPCFALFSAGEIQCTAPDQLRFNFFSGTYKMDKRISASKRVTSNESAFITHMLNRFAPGYTSGRVDDAFITYDNNPVTDDELRRLDALRVPILRFRTKQACQALHSQVRIKSGQSLRWLSNDELYTVINESRHRMGDGYLGMYGSWGWGSAIRSWIPPQIPGSMWHKSKARRGGKGRKRTGKRALTKKAKRTKTKAKRVIKST